MSHFLLETLPATLKIAKLLLSARVKTLPLLFYPLALLRQDEKKTVVRRHTDLLISGYWRCANHYASYAFISSQKRPVRVAHHFHAPAQVMLAVRWNVPTLLLIREPVGAVCSATVYLEHDDPHPFLKFFNIYHRALVPYRDQIVISDFKQTTTNFGSVIAEINQRYGRDFDLYHGTPEDEQRIEEMIREEYRVGLDSRPARLPLPSHEKDLLKEEIKQKLFDPRCAALLDEARQLYQHFYSASRGA